MYDYSTVPRHEACLLVPKEICWLVFVDQRPAKKTRLSFGPPQSKRGGSNCSNFRTYPPATYLNKPRAPTVAKHEQPRQRAASMDAMLPLRRAASILGSTSMESQRTRRTSTYDTWVNTASATPGAGPRDEHRWRRGYPSVRWDDALPSGQRLRVSIEATMRGPVRRSSSRHQLTFTWPQV